MSATFVAGQGMRAIDMVPQKIWTASATSANTASTAEVVALTGTSSTYRAGRAYLLSIRLPARAVGAATNMILRVRDTNASGTVRMDPVRWNLADNTSVWGLHYEHYVANTSGSDITSRVLVLTHTGSANTVRYDASAAHPAYFSCTEMGSSTDFPEAVAL